MSTAIDPTITCPHCRAEINLKVAEKEQPIAVMQEQSEELKRKAEQGSQQLQEEVQELDLAGTLRTEYPHDLIEPAPRGEHGEKVLHRVFGPLRWPNTYEMHGDVIRQCSLRHQVCGTILWEFKRAKNWSDGWPSKLREDQLSAKATRAVIVSQALPMSMDENWFENIDGVYVTSPRYVSSVACLCRSSVIQRWMALEANYKGKGRIHISRKPPRRVGESTREALLGGRTKMDPEMT